MINGFSSDMLYRDETAYCIKNKIKHNREE